MTGLQVLRALAIAALASIAFSPSLGVAQDDPAGSAWQAEKCQLYRQNRERPLDFFGTDTVNYDFMAQNENFIASQCTAPHLSVHGQIKRSKSQMPLQSG